MLHVDFLLFRLWFVYSSSRCFFRPSHGPWKSKITTRLTGILHFFFDVFLKIAAILHLLVEAVFHFIFAATLHLHIIAIIRISVSAIFLFLIVAAVLRNLRLFVSFSILIAIVFYSSASDCYCYKKILVSIFFSYF